MRGIFSKEMHKFRTTFYTFLGFLLIISYCFMRELEEMFSSCEEFVLKSYLWIFKLSHQLLKLRGRMNWVSWEHVRRTRDNVKVIAYFHLEATEILVIPMSLFNIKLITNQKKIQYIWPSTLNDLQKNVFSTIRKNLFNSNSFQLLIQAHTMTSLQAVF